MEIPEIRITCCPACGGPVAPHETIGGTRYLIAVSDHLLQEIMTRQAVDQFVRDRLQRAEKIIVSLREKVRSLEAKIGS